LQNLKKENRSKDPDVNGRLIIKWTLKEHVGKTWTELGWLWIGKMAV
jgi:hypothetical protein